MSRKEPTTGGGDTVSLEDVFDELERRRQTVTVYASDADRVSIPRLVTRNVDVRYRELPVGSADPFLTVRRDGSFAGSLPLRDLGEFAEPPIGSVGAEETGDRLSALLGLLDDTVFHSLTRRQLLATSREFEDRAWRVGAGQLRVGFQSPSALSAQRDVYERLAAHRDLTVRIYFDGEWDQDPIEGVRLHPSDSEEIGRFWFLAFDGGPDPDQACLLLARERDRDPGSYAGVWTYGGGTVQRVVDHLSSTYE